MHYDPKPFVAAGIAFLDSQEGCQLNNWPNKINLLRFDLSDPEDCVLGQLFDSFNRGKNRLELTVGRSAELGFVSSAAAADGFDIDDPMQREMSVKQYAALTAEWRSSIERLRAAD